MTAAETVNRELLYPNGDDPVPNWPSINRNNLDKLDSLLNLPIFQSYAPSLSPSTGSPNIGTTGQLLGRYYRLFDIYFFYIWLTLGGSGVDMGTGTIRFTLPVPADSSYNFGNNGSSVGGGYFFDSSSGLNRTPLTVKLSSSSNNDAIFMPVSVNMPSRTSWVVQGNNPSAMTAGDQIEIYGRFKAAA